MKWNLTPFDAADAAAVSTALGISLLAARVLVARGYGDPEAARRFLSPTAADLNDPVLLAGMDAATHRLALAIERREPILLYGDYDVDGTSAIVLLKKTLEQTGGITSCHVPHRIRDGYGMKSEVVEEAAAQGVKLIVSVDTGIRANDVVRHASALGIDVIVTDHHLPEADLPPALAVLNPNRPDCGYPDKTPNDCIHWGGGTTTTRRIADQCDQASTTATTEKSSDNCQSRYLDSLPLC